MVQKRASAKYILLGLIFLVGYVVLDWLSYWHPIGPLAITPWNPAPGLCIALALHFNKRLLLLFFPSAMLAEWLVRDAPTNGVVLFCSSALLAMAYIALALVWQRVLPLSSFKRPRDVTVSLLVIALSSLLTGSIFVAVFHVSGFLEQSQIGLAVLQFWIGDFIGIALTAPLALILFQQPWKTLSVQRHDVIWLVLLFTLLLWIFALEYTDEFRWFYLLFIPLIGMALNRGVLGALMVAALTQVTMIALMRYRDSPVEIIRYLQLLMVSFLATGLYLAVVIEERTAALLAQQETERRWQTLVSIAPDAIVMFDQHRKILHCNEAAKRLWNRPLEQLLGQNIDEWLRLSATQNRVERQWLTINNEVVAVDVAWAGDAGIFIAVIRDMRETERLNAEVEVQQQALFRANKMAAVSELASALAHELNQPLTAVGLYLRSAKLLAQNRSANNDAILLDTLEKATQDTLRAGNVIHHLREFYREGTLTLRAISLGDWLVTLADTFKGRAQAQQCKIVLDIAADLPKVMIDIVHLQTVMDNLLRNALEATSSRPHACIRISAICDKHDVVLMVEDNGGGVAPDILPMLFHSIASDKAHGLGLGLKICRQLMSAHGGALEYERAADGARFIVRLPVAKEFMA